MSAGTIGALIPIVALSIPIVAIWTKHKTRIAEMQIRATADDTAERAAQYVTKTRELEERVRVLERIVTDKGYDIAAQIEALRDTRSVEDHAKDYRRDPLN
ncbi:MULTISPECIES: hypothetical protein [Novosphingobium]|uniref:Phage shock protein B n=1 Tax=Novosphingobium sediminicola TaxID=563162 RepID=A0A7W6G5X2_9SPHN|nr:MULTISPECIES: hypothetical protein [Novosphingobium]MBB3955209.1 hypothetical protein [Novosphingobium sediminicola]NOW44667.1 hypothetical protein [Novosphingobium sp. SG751A]